MYNLTKGQWIKVAKEYEQKGGKALAKKFKVSYGVIATGVMIMRKAGIKIGKPHIRRNSGLSMAIAKLKSKQ